MKLVFTYFRGAVLIWWSEFGMQADWKAFGKRIAVLAGHNQVEGGAELREG